MGMEIALIPAAMFIMGIGMMIYMKKKRGSLAPGYAQQEMKRFVKEMVPQLSEEEFHVIDCPWITDSSEISGSPPSNHF